MTTVSVLLVDDHALFGEALQARLRQERDLDPVLLATSANEALAVLNNVRPDVALLDVCLGNESGIDLAQHLLEVAPQCRVIMLSEADDVTTVVDALRHGAMGWLPKTTNIGELLSSIRGVMRGEARLGPSLLGSVLPELIATSPPPSNALAMLTSREREVLQYLLDGRTRNEIATMMLLSPNTVRTHTQNLLAKLNVHSTLEAVALALRTGLRASDS